MGAYLSEPITEKISSDENGERLSCGASSMQGWRVSQEDAHNCIIDFDVDTSLFAVYDGHGGHEVAQYCSQKFPDFLKTTESYKKKELKQALIDAILQFDATLTTPEVIEILKELAGDKSKENKDEEMIVSSDEEEPQDEVNHLCEEASMPLDKVMEKYQNKHLIKVQDKKPISPYLRCKKESRIAEDGAGSSGENKLLKKNIGNSTKEQNGEITTELDHLPVEKKDGEDTESNFKVKNEDKLSEKVLSNENKSEESQIEENKSKNIKSEEVKSEESRLEKTKSKETKSEKKSDESKPEKEDNKHEEIKNEEKPSVNGELNEKKPEEDVKNGGSIKGKGKAKKPPPKILKDRKAKNMAFSNENIQAIYTAILSGFVPDDDTEESDDEHDDTFKADEIEKNSSEDEDDEDEEESDLGEEEASDEEDEDNEMNEDDDDDDIQMNMTEEPGSDSGCTAVVALLRGNELYVANAGDSRCIVCRKGEVVEMSLDHKPETEEENNRIVKAGGKVTADGRVNGGLNLSRAIGDHTYKQNKDLPPEEQMITALPDVTTLTITPYDEFIVLACDGIWNFMSNEEVIDFVRPRLADGRRKISEICEEMFDHCLAPNTMGDGTGCDNMTAIIIQLQKQIVGGIKRNASSLKEDTENAKRSKLDENFETTIKQSENSTDENTSGKTDEKAEKKDV